MAFKSLINGVLILSVLVISALAQTASQRSYSRADFVSIDGGSLSDRIERATRQFRDSKVGETVWLAYHFPVNEAMSLGPLSGPFSGQLSGTIYRDDDGIRLDRRDDPQGAAVVLLAETSGAQAIVIRVKTLNLAEPYVFENRPVFWLGSVDATESVNYLESIMHSQPTDTSLVRGTLRAIGSHKEKRVVALLREFVQKETTEELQRAAISNLGRVGSLQSVEALISLYEANISDPVKDEVIAALGHQAERRAADKLLAIAKNDANPKLRQSAIRRLSTRQNSPFAINLR